ncbi:MAG: PAQR family membrane homeostasis protein TrhA [Acidimicrobiia bacterium]
MSVGTRPLVGERLRLGVIENPVRALLHGTGAIASVIGWIVLLVQRSHPALVIYGGTLVGMYSASTFYHAVPWGTVWKARMQKLDHAFIYLLVAGTFTALLAGSMPGSFRWGALVVVWSLAAIGIGREFLPALSRKWVLVAQQCLGALALWPIAYLFDHIGGSVQLLTIGGGLIYVGGLAMFVRSWPRLFPRVFGFHETFHVLVIAASVAHFLAVWQIWVSSR